MVWYIARASGIVNTGRSWPPVSAGACALTARPIGAPPPPGVATGPPSLSWPARALVFLAVHVGLDLGRHLRPLRPGERLLVPLHGRRRHPVAVAWGIVAMYVLVALEVTSLLRAHAQGAGGAALRTMPASRCSASPPCTLSRPVPGTPQPRAEVHGHRRYRWRDCSGRRTGR